MPTIEKDTYFKYLEHKGQAGYRAAILVKEQSVQLYSLLVASETVPSVFGTPDSFEFDLLNSPVKGKIAGKMSLDDKEVEVLHHRDNVYRFEQLKNKVLDFMVVDSNFVGYKFSGTLSYRMNDASADVLRGTYTITPMSADPNPVLDARSLCEETLCFADVVPDTAKAGDKINLSVVQTSANATFTAAKINENGTETPETSAISGGVFTAPTGGGLYAITASATGYASWTTTVYVEA
jgi:hypothetical protein